MKKILSICAIGAALLLSGCVAVPYDNPYPYAYGGPYYAPYGYYGGPPVYVQPSVSFGFGYYSGYGHRGGGWGGHGGH